MLINPFVIWNTLIISIDTFNIYLITFICVCVFIHTHVHVGSLQKSEGGIGSPEAGIKGGCKAPVWMLVFWRSPQPS